MKKLLSIILLLSITTVLSAQGKDYPFAKGGAIKAPTSKVRYKGYIETVYEVPYKGNYKNTVGANLVNAISFGGFFSLGIGVGVSTDPSKGRYLNEREPVFSGFGVLETNLLPKTFRFVPFINAFAGINSIGMIGGGSLGLRYRVNPRQAVRFSVGYAGESTQAMLGGRHQDREVVSFKLGFEFW